MNEKTKYEMLTRREFLKGYQTSYIHAESTDQKQNLENIPYVKRKKGTDLINLPMDFEDLADHETLYHLIQNRQSRRKYSPEPVSLKELSFLLWSVQGIQKTVGDTNPFTFRTVPSAGSRHAFELYLFVNHAEGLKKGIYHYLPLEHSLEIWEDRADFEEELTQALCGQRFAASAPVLLVWSALPYRMEWRYGRQAHKYILLDAGHSCENLYLACESIGYGTCAIGAYDQECLDELLGFPPGPSGEREYECSIYAAPIGKVKKRKTSET